MRLKMSLLAASVVSIVVAASASASLPPQAKPQLRPAVGESSGLYAVDALSDSDVWAVGRGGGSEGPLLDHWDGEQWTRVDGPNLRHASLQSVSASTSNDVWAVGYQVNADKYYRPLAEHWDGSSWTVTPVMRTAPRLQAWIELSGVSVVSSDDVWAVGSRGAYGDEDGYVYRPLVFHWNGHRWSRVESASTGDAARLISVAAVSPDDVWAVGFDGFGSNDGCLSEHWDGRSWSRVACPVPPSGHDYALWGVSFDQGAGLWAAGFDDNESGPRTTLVLRWDGSEWTRVRTFTKPQRDTRLYAIDAIGSNDVWTVGFARHDGSHAGKEVAEHYDGARFRLTGTPWDSGAPRELYGVSGAGVDDVWAVGHDVILHWDGSGWSQFDAPSARSGTTS